MKNLKTFSIFESTGVPSGLTTTTQKLFKGIVERLERGIEDLSSISFQKKEIQTKPTKINEISFHFLCHGDFKIGDIYLQIDGRYWHGLDRPLEEIKQSSAGRDKSIYQRWFSDREQDEQFFAAGLRLVRITDKEAKEWLRDKKLLLETLMLKNQDLW